MAANPSAAGAARRPEALARGAPGGKSGDRKPAARKADFRPSRDDILRFIEENPDRSGKRDIAKAMEHRVRRG